MSNKFLLLEYLIGQNGFKSSYELAEILSVSSKTVTRYIKDLNEILYKFGFEIVSKQGLGYGFNISKSDRLLLKKIYQKNLLPLNRVDEDFYKLFKKLLSIKKFTPLELSNELYTSESNIYKELKKIRAYINKFHLKMITNANGKIDIIGDYENKVQCILNYMHNLPEKRSINFLPLITYKDFTSVYKNLQEFILDNKFVISDMDLNFLIDLILVCVNEIRAQNITSNYDKPDEIVYKLLVNLSIELKIKDFNIYEKVIYEWINKLLLMNKDEYYTKLKGDVVSILSEFDTSITDRLMQNENLINQLVFHISKFINRTTKGISIDNPVINDIKQEFPIEFSLSYYLCKNIEKKYKSKLNEDEIGFIAVYLAIQREQLEANNQEVAIICHYGVGTANLIKQKIQHNFPNIKIIGIFSYLRKSEAYTLNPDFIISSIKLEDCPYKYVYIDNVFGDDYIENVRHITSIATDQKYLVNLASKLDFYEISALNNIEAIETIGRKLIRKNKIDDLTLESVLEREFISSTDIGNAVAIPHTITKNQDESFISVCRLEKPIKWGSDFVQLVFFIVFNDMDKENLRAFKALYDFIDNSRNIENLLDDFNYERFKKLVS